MATPAQITDRAKRYRAQKNVTGPKKCVLCGVGGRLDVMHLTGNESHGEKENLAYGCRSCNTALGAAFKKLKLGKPTNQYNPAKGIPTFEQYMWAVSTGAREYYANSTRHAAGVKDEAGAIIHATPKHKRVEYAKRIARKASATKRQQHEDRWNPTWDGRPITQAERNRRYAEEDRERAEAEAHAEKVREFQAKQLQRGRRNPSGAAAEVFEDFHGFKSSEVVTVSKRVHRHEHLAALGYLISLDVWGVDGQGHHITEFQKALLCCNEDRNQLFIEGGDQAIDLAEYGIRQTHELETLGRVTNIGYKTDKKHLGAEGGKAIYVHRFRATNQNGKHVLVKMTREPDLIYDVRNEQLLFSGGSYEILREGINK